MSGLRVLVLAAAALCAGCETVIVRPASAPECSIPAELKSACADTVTLGDPVTYGDLPEIALNTRADFTACRLSYLRLREAYQICVDGQKQFNDSLKKFEDEARRKHKNASVLQE
jgi:hypothetical protein